MLRRTASHHTRTLRSVVPPIALLGALAGCGGSALAPDSADTGAPLIAASVPACQGPAQSLAPALAAQFRGDGDRSSDAMLADLSRRAPGGFAGVFYEGSGPASSSGRPTLGRPVLLLTDPSQASAAKAAIAPALPNFDVAGAEVRKARWTFAQLYEWYRYLGNGPSGFWSAPNVTMSDINEVRNRIEVGVADEPSRAELTRRLSSINLPCDLIHVLIVPPAVPR